MEHEKQQVIITIGREYGSGGHLIADMLGEKYGLPVYDSTIIEVIAKEKNLNLEKLKEYDEKPRNRLFTRSIDGYSNSPEDVIAYMEFDFLREKRKIRRELHCGGTLRQLHPKGLPGGHQHLCDRRYAGKDPARGDGIPCFQ